MRLHSLNVAWRSRAHFLLLHLRLTLCLYNNNKSGVYRALSLVFLLPPLKDPIVHPLKTSCQCDLILNLTKFIFRERDGNPGWGYHDVLHYFKKSEDNRNPYLANTYYHGAGGFLTVQVGSENTPTSILCTTFSGILHMNVTEWFVERGPLVCLSPFSVIVWIRQG